MDKQLYEHGDRLILVLDDGRSGGWAWSTTDYQWRRVTPEYAGIVWTEGTPISVADAERRYRIDGDQMPA